MLKPYHERTEEVTAICASAAEDPDNLPLPDLLAQGGANTELGEVQLGDRRSTRELAQILELIREKGDTFSNQPGYTPLATHRVETPGQHPLRQTPYRIPESVKDHMRKEIDEMLQLGVIEHSDSPWASPVVLVPKRDGTTRFCVDYQKLNDKTISDAYPMPRIDELLDKMARGQYLTTIDLCKGYWQIPLAEDAIPKSAFVTPFGLYQFKVMPFGMKNAPATFQRMVDRLLDGSQEYACAYLDDIAIFSNSWDEHLTHIGAILDRIREAGLTLKPSKCHVGMAEVQYLGYMVGSGQQKPEPAKIEAVAKWPTPRTKTQVLAFLGTAGYYRKFVPNYSALAKPLTDLTKKNLPKVVTWSPECEKAFQELKTALIHAPVLAAPDQTKRFLVHTDASMFGLGAVLSQVGADGGEHPVAYLSRKLRPREVSYAAIEKECLAVVWALKKLQPYLYGQQFALLTDHNPLVWLKRVSGDNARLLRWSLALQPFDFIIQYRPGKQNGSEYSVDIEISFQDPLLQDSIRNYINSLPYPISLNGSGTNISSIIVTTACTQSGNSMQCTCEDGYVWSSDICAAYPPCNATTASSCNCITMLQNQGIYCQPQTVTPVSITLSLRINDAYTSDLNDPSSAKYKKYKNDLENAFNKSYSSLRGFQSATVTGFRPGSVIADYTIVAEAVNDSLIQNANQNVIQNLNGTLEVSSIQKIITGNSSVVSKPPLFVGDNAVLTCTANISSYTDVSWYFNGTDKIPGSALIPLLYSVNTVTISGVVTSFLNIKNINASVTGSYQCIVNQGSNSYVAETSLKVLPIKITLLGANVGCNSTEVNILRCCSDDGIDSLDLTCQNTSGNSKVAKVTAQDKTLQCNFFKLTASPDQCSSGTYTDFTCTCATASGLPQTRTFTVTYVQLPTVTITQPAGNIVNISEERQLSMTCTSSVNTALIWWFSSRGDFSSATVISSKYYPISSTLTIPATDLNINWNGTIFCSIANSAVTRSQKIVHVYNLISTKSISIEPVNSNFECGKSITFQCCVDNMQYYRSATLQLSPGTPVPLTVNGECFSTTYNATCTSQITAYCTIVNNLGDSVNSGSMMVKQVVQAGNIIYTCTQQATATNWVPQTPSPCVSAALNRLNVDLLGLTTSPNAETQVPALLGNLSSTVVSEQGNITSSASNIQLVVNILAQVQAVTTTVPVTVMTDFLSTVSIIIDPSSTDTWRTVQNQTQQSSSLLQSVESFASKLIVTGPISIGNNSNVQLKGILLTDTSPQYKENFSFPQPSNLTAKVEIGNLESIKQNSSIISIAYATLNDILPKSNVSGLINGLVMTTLATVDNKEKFNISMVFEKSNTTLNNPACVYWNFTVQDWTSDGCSGFNYPNNVTCTCNHLTSFSILMSYKPDAPDDPVLDNITYIGVGISLFSLVICIIVEGIVWKSVTKNKTSYMRHVCLVNIAISLLIADIWFIIGSALTANKPVTITDACVATTFFSHLFYLSVFFWMLTMGLILFYRLVYVLHDMSKSTMMIVSFTLGYGCPVIISVVAVAVTQPNKIYTSKVACWLNIGDSNAFIAFVVPALSILLVNTIILCVVLKKICRPSIGDRHKKEETSTLRHIAKCIVILTPLLGLTWGIGIGLLFYPATWLEGIFAFFNSLQGFFILLFGCLMDKKVREALFNKFSLSRFSSQQTKSTNISSSDSPFPKGVKSKGIINLFPKKGAYNISSAQLSSSSDGPSNSYSLLT
ncbi:adhesion G protein-coupled receptor F5-like [Pelodytes ibericus]